MAEARRLLIVSSTFYPDPMVAALRMTQFARHLPQHGWHVRVLCRHYGYEAKDLPAGVDVRYLSPAPAAPSGGPAPKASKLKSFISWLAFIPDPSIRFWRSVQSRVLAAAEEFDPHVVLTTSPPQATHAMGRLLQQARGIPWVVDLREAYLADPRYRPPGLACLRWPAHKAFEAMLYEHGDLLLHQLPVHFRWARRKFAFARDRIHLLTNGFARELIDGSIAPLKSTRHSVRVVGTVTIDELTSLAKAVKLAVDRGGDLELVYVGRTGPGLDPLQQLLGDRLKMTGFVDHPTAMAYLLGADLLVNYLDPARQNSVILSAKLIEYIATGMPVLEVSGTTSDRLFSSRWPQVRHLTSPTVEQLATALVEPSAVTDPAKLASYRAEYDWSDQVRELARLMNELCLPGHATRG